MTFSPDGKSLALGVSAHSAILWDVVTVQEVLTLSGSWAISEDSIAFSPDGKTLALDSEEGTVIWDIVTGEKMRTLNVREDLAFSQGGKTVALTFSQDGKTLVSLVYDNGKIVLWDVMTGQQVRTFHTKTVGSDSRVHSIALSPDGKTLALINIDQIVELWDAAAGKQIRILKGHTSNLRSVAFSPDGKTLASGSVSEAILWDVATGEEMHTLLESANSIIFSPDGKTLITGGFLATGGYGVILWDIATGLPKHFFVGVNRAAFSPDGKKLLLGEFGDISGSGNMVMLWDVPVNSDVSGSEGDTLPLVP
jgi:WD40 repeat protein